ncbi:sulfatase-like hydrolase/transferase [Termitidicoccus mucosus]
MRLHNPSPLEPVGRSKRASIARRTFIKASGLVALGRILGRRDVAAFAGDEPDAQPPAAFGKPDIFVIFTDQWSTRETSRWGSPVRTPNLDAVAREGMRFGCAYSSCPISMPARTDLLTGLFPHSTGLWGNTIEWAPIVAQARLFADMKTAGYTTAQIGKTHWLSGNMWKQQSLANPDAFYAALKLDHVDNIPSPFSTPGAPKSDYARYLKSIGKWEAVASDLAHRLRNDSYLPKASACTPEEHNEMFVANRTIEFLQKQPLDKPLFLVASWFGPHNPLDAPEPYASMYDPDSLAMPPNLKFPISSGGYKYDERQWRKMRANYLGKITYIDHCVGKVFDALKKRGNWDNTLIIFISDHGDMMGAHGAMAKGSFYEESVGVPMWVRPPKGVKVAAPESGVPVSLNDVYATVVEAAGGKVSPQRVTRSLLPIVRGEVTEDDGRTVFSEIYFRNKLSCMTRKGDYKWFYQQGREHLFNLKQDPYELTNLIAAPAHAALAREMKENYHEWLFATQINYSEGYKPMALRAKEGTL